MNHPEIISDYHDHDGLKFGSHLLLFVHLQIPATATGCAAAGYGLDPGLLQGPTEPFRLVELKCQTF